MCVNTETLNIRRECPRPSIRFRGIFLPADGSGGAGPELVRVGRTDRLYALAEELRAVAPRPRSARWSDISE